MNREAKVRLVKRVVGVALSLAFAFVAIVGFAHTKTGRPLLAVIGPMLGMHAKGGCPLGYDKAATPEQRAASERRFSNTHRGETAAAIRPALGFELDRTTESDVMAWAKDRSVDCVKPRGGHDLECSHVHVSALPASSNDDVADLTSLWLDFGADETLIAVTTVRRESRPEAISAAFAQVTGTIEHQAGPASQATGDASSAALASGALYQATTEYKFTNYYARARATNMGDGYVLTENYRALAD